MQNTDRQIWNAQNKVCGITDVDLTDKGREQAKALVFAVADKNINVIIFSPLKRAVETSRIVSDMYNIPIKIDERLIEQNYGIYEGVDRYRVRNEHALKK